MTKKNSLKQALSAAANSNLREQLEQVDTTDIIIQKQKPAKSRVGTKIISGHFDIAVSMQLKRIAIDETTTVQELLREALNELFVKKGKAPIA